MIREEIRARPGGGGIILETRLWYRGAPLGWRGCVFLEHDAAGRLHDELRACLGLPPTDGRDLGGE